MATSRGTTVTASFPNRLVAWMLRSPIFSSLVSGKTMLVTVRGRKTGKLYTTPVNYVRQANTILVISRAERTWWKNLRGGAPITLLLKGKEIQAMANVTENDPNAFASVYRAWHPGLRNTAKAAEKISRRAEHGVVVRITLPA